MLKGKLKITMVFEVPVSESLYPQIQKQNAILRKEMRGRFWTRRRRITSTMWTTT